MANPLRRSRRRRPILGTGDVPLAERLDESLPDPDEVDVLGLPAPKAPPKPPPPTRTHRFDARTGDAVRTAVDLIPAANTLTRHTTDLGSMFMATTASGFLYRLGHRRMAVEVLAAGTFGWVIAQETKKQFDRPRPYQAEGVRRLIPEPTGSSMPSGHSSVVGAVTTVLAGHSRVGRRWPWPFVAAWVPATRIHLGVHYPSDTAVGLSMGYVIGLAIIAVSGRLGRGSS